MNPDEAPHGLCCPVCDRDGLISRCPHCGGWRWKWHCRLCGPVTHAYPQELSTPPEGIPTVIPNNAPVIHDPLHSLPEDVHRAAELVLDALYRAVPRSGPTRNAAAAPAAERGPPPMDR
jgi:hypothetical protein